MFDIANREIEEAMEARRRRSPTSTRPAALMSALDDVLRELEELNLARELVPPAACRARAAALIGLARGLDGTPRVPNVVPLLMDTVYEAQETLLVRHRRAAVALAAVPGRP